MSRGKQGLSHAEALRLYPLSGDYRGPSASDMLKPYADQGAVCLTGYERFYTWTTGPLHWRLVVINEQMAAEIAGSEFESKTEALLALPALARQHGCVRSSR